MFLEQRQSVSNITRNILDRELHNKSHWHFSLGMDILPCSCMNEHHLLFLTRDSRPFLTTKHAQLFTVWLSILISIVIFIYMQVDKMMGRMYTLEYDRISPKQRQRSYKVAMFYVWWKSLCYDIHKDDVISVLRIENVDWKIENPNPDFFSQSICYLYIRSTLIFVLLLYPITLTKIIINYVSFLVEVLE